MSSSQSAAAWASASSLPFRTRRFSSSRRLRARLPMMLAAWALAEEVRAEARRSSKISSSSSMSRRRPKRSSSSSVTRRMSPFSSFTRKRPFFLWESLTSSTRMASPFTCYISYRSCQGSALRRRKLRIPSPAASGRCRSLRCASSPHRTRFAGLRRGPQIYQGSALDPPPFEKGGRKLYFPPAKRSFAVKFSFDTFLFQKKSMWAGP